MYAINISLEIGSFFWSQNNLTPELGTQILN